ncbi:hypothetical protein ALC57_05366 [Trachymyrmex cornetzi]|uniref:MADF domain-containing protein n=1 Tax=Trachymyrmex cornetzi TaxID=471704 RepID=A0A151JB37_9HYME|nr:hypothetical protein ALC57_05366 [Trachymyrmex cornetzi]
MNHSCFHPFDDEINAFNVDENFIVTVVMREEYDNNFSEPGTSTCQLTNNKDDEQQEVNIDELLITCVARKRALFNYRLPANERSNLKKKALWQEVCNLMGGVLSVDEAKRRWRYLRDCYMV